MHAPARSYEQSVEPLGPAAGSWESGELVFDDSRLAPSATPAPAAPDATDPTASPSGRSTRRLRRRDEFYGGEPGQAPPPPRRSSRRQEVSDDTWRQALAFAGVPLCPVCRAQNPLSSNFCARCQHPLAPTPPSSASLPVLRRRRWPLRLAGLAATCAAVGAAGMIWGQAVVELLLP